MKLRQRLEPTEIKFVVEPLQAARSRVAPTALSSSVNLICPHSAITLVEPLSTVSGSEAGSRMVGRRISFYSHLPPATISRPMRFRRDRNPRHETDSFFSPLKSFLNLAERSHVTASGFFFTISELGPSFTGFPQFAHSSWERWFVKKDTSTIECL